MRVLHILDHSIPLHSGYTFRTAAILREQRRLGIETFHLTSAKHTAASPAEEEVDGLRFFRTTPPTGWRVRLPVLREFAQMAALEARMLEVAAETRPDLLHAHSPALNAHPAIRVGRHLGIPVVYEIRAFWEDAAVDHGTSSEHGPRYRATRALETQALQRVAHAFTICEGLRKDIAARGIAESKLTVIPNAVDIEHFQLAGSPDPALRTQLGLDGAAVLGFIGSFYGYEGLNLLVTALPLILREIPTARLLLVGGGPEEERLKTQVRSAGLESKVVFTGRVPHAAVTRYYDLVDLLCYPRLSMRLTELVTPLKPLEAMAQGRVFVASDVGGHRELVRDGETGLLFRAGSAEALASKAISALRDVAGLPAIRRAGRAFVENERNWKNSVARYVPVYERLTGQRIGGGS